MHNMIVEDERDDGIHDQWWKFQGELIAPHPEAAIFDEFLHVHEEIHDRATRDQL
jgi:hypothetical protein